MLTSVYRDMASTKTRHVPATADGIAERVALLIEKEKETGGSARSLSVRAGLGKGHAWAIANGERGKREVTRDVIDKLAAAANVSARWLETGLGSPDDSADRWLGDRHTPPPRSGVYPRRDQAIEMLQSYSVGESKPDGQIRAAVIAGLRRESPPEDLTLEGWFERALKLEDIVRSYLAPRKET